MNARPGYLGTFSSLQTFAPLASDWSVKTRADWSIGPQLSRLAAMAHSKRDFSNTPDIRHFFCLFVHKLFFIIFLPNFACGFIRSVASEISKNIYTIIGVRIFVQLFRRGLESLTDRNF